MSQNQKVPKVPTWKKNPLIIKNAQYCTRLHFRLYTVSISENPSDWENAKLIFSLLETNFVNNFIIIAYNYGYEWGPTLEINSLLAETKKWLALHHQLKCYMVSLHHFRPE